MKKIIIFFFIILLTGCSNNIETTNPTTNVESSEILEKNEHLEMYIGDSYDFKYDEYVIEGESIEIKDEKIIAIKEGQASIRLILSNTSHLITIDVYEDDLKPFENFLNEYKMVDDYSFNVYGGYKSYSYKREKDDFYFIIDDMEIKQSLIKNKTKARPGTIRDIKWLVIHETGNISPSADAKNHENYIRKLAINNKESISWHYTVDDKIIYNHVPDNEIAWHAGDGTKDIGTNGYYLGGGNKNGIGIEICINQGNDIIKSMKKASMLAVNLCMKYNLSIDKIKTHSDFSKKLCPYTILYNNMWDEFMMMVEANYLLLNEYQNYNIEKLENGYKIKNLESGRTKTIKLGV